MAGIKKVLTCDALKCVLIDTYLMRQCHGNFTPIFAFWAHNTWSKLCKIFHLREDTGIFLEIAKIYVCVVPPYFEMIKLLLIDMVTHLTNCLLVPLKFFRCR